ncbi:MAG: LPS export ABC transporter permease LptG [Xanthomonadales bacterium]|nr:LPS export ABC transporter permease LptG [Xanthomonadales bacterium]
MMIMLDRYIMRQFLLGIAPVLLLLLALFSFMALAEELEDVGQGAFTTFDALRVVFYTAPRRIVDLMPVTTLLGGLLGLGAMANHQELIVMRTIGLSRRRIGRPVLLLGLLIALGVGAAQSLLVPYGESEAGKIRARALSETGVDSDGGPEFWTRSHNRFVRVNEVQHGQWLTDLEVYTLDSAGRVEQLVQARYAALVGLDRWRLDQVTVTRLGRDGLHEERHEALLWPGLLSREQAEILVRPLESLAPWELFRLVTIRRANGLSDHRHRVVLWQQLSIPVALVAMALLTLPLLLGSLRTISAGTRIVIGGGVGIGFYLLQQMGGHLAGLFTLSPALLIMMPAVLLLAASVLFLYLELRH